VQHRLVVVDDQNPGGGGGSGGSHDVSCIRFHWRKDNPPELCASVHASSYAAEADNRLLLACYPVMERTITRLSLS
jgi:hypothetical protein